MVSENGNWKIEIHGWRRAKLCVWAARYRRNAVALFNLHASLSQLVSKTQSLALTRQPHSDLHQSGFIVGLATIAVGSWVESMMASTCGVCRSWYSTSGGSIIDSCDRSVLATLDSAHATTNTATARIHVNGFLRQAKSHFRFIIFHLLSLELACPPVPFKVHSL